MASRSLVVASEQAKGPEVFYALQGEGPHAGRPSVFLRLSRCNLYCVWCDTPYTWNWVDTPFVHRVSEKYTPDTEQLTLEPERLCDLAMEFPCRALVVTGGEPLLQQDALLVVLQMLRARDPRWQFDFETNGTIHPSEDLLTLGQTFVVSPKLANAGVRDGLRLRDPVLRSFAGSGKAYFKFVVASEADLDEIDALAIAHALPRKRILVMPEGADPETLTRREPDVVRWARARGYRYSDRLHVRTHGGARGT